MPKSRFKDWVNTEVAKQLDKERFSSLPLRMRIGIFFLITSFTVGYGFPIAILIISGFHHQFISGLVAGSIVYTVSWVVGAIGLVLAGRDCIKYPIYFAAKFLKKLFPQYFDTDQ